MCALFSPLGVLQDLTPSWPPIISPEQQLMLGLASGNRNTTSPQGKFHYSPCCDFLSWYRETHTPLRKSHGKMHITCTAQHSLSWECNTSRYSLSHKLFSHSTPHNLVPYLHFAWKKQATLSSIRNESRTHSNKWGDKQEPRFSSWTWSQLLLWPSRAGSAQDRKRALEEQKNLL